MFEIARGGIQEPYSLILVTPEFHISETLQKKNASGDYSPEMTMIE